MRYLRAIIVYTWAVLVLVTRWPLLRAVEGQREDNFLAAMNRIHRVAKPFAGQVCRLAGCKVEVQGLENIPQEGSVVLIGNHQSFFDIPIILANVNRPLGFLAKQELGEVPIFGRWTAGIGSIFIPRGESRKSLEAILNAVKMLKKAAHILVVFPEGTRSYEGKVGDFKAGSLKIATKSGAPVVPFAMDGSWRIMPRDVKTFTPGTVRLTFLPAISDELMATKDTKLIAEACRQAILAQLAEGEEDERKK